jgi:hypothetical protein
MWTFRINTNSIFASKGTHDERTTAHEILEETPDEDQGRTPLEKDAQPGDADAVAAEERIGLRLAFASQRRQR